MKSLSGKYIWIIGASSGIGAALARQMAAEGASLIISARTIENLYKLQEQIGIAHAVYPLDVTDAKAFKAVASDVRQSIPRLDSVIYLAGHYQPMSMDQLDLDECRDIVDTNLNGALNFIHAVLPILLDQKSGQIAICASVAGYSGLPNAQPYGATKAALINLTESLALEMRGRGIDVKLINPGFVRTPMTDKNSFAMPMMIEPEEAAKAIAHGLQSSHFEIHFPKRFTLLLKFMRLLPAWIYLRIVRL